MNSMDPILRKISKARSLLLLNNPWFGALAMRLAVQEAEGTMATDGTHLFYNPAFVEKLDNEELRGVVAHEIMHVAAKHIWRRNKRDHKLWNISCDFAINDILTQCGFKLPEGALLDPKFSNMSSEQIYAILEQQQQQRGGQGYDHTACGEFLDPPKGGSDKKDKDEEESEGSGGQPKPEPMSETDWEIAIEQATAVAQKAGKLPGQIAAMVNAMRETETDWKTVLKRFIQHIKPSHLSWARPNRRLLHQGIYLPGVVKENTPMFTIAIDTSGSITQEVLDIFASEVNAIKHEVKPERIQILYCDARIQGEDWFETEDELTFRAPGRGGTAFTPVFQHIANQEEKPAAILYLTDLFGDNNVVPDIGIPTLWVTSEKSNQQAPFGELVRLSTWQD